MLSITFADLWLFEFLKQTFGEVSEILAFLASRICFNNELWIVGKTTDTYQTYALEFVATETAQRQHTNVPAGSCLLQSLQVHSVGNGWELFNLWYTVL